MKKTISYIDQQDLMTQARETRDADWEEQEESLNLQLRAGDLERKATTIEWGSDFTEGSLVETRDGDIGMVLKQYDPTHNRVVKPKHIKAAMIGSYVRLLVNGLEEWHTKLSVSAPEDN